MDTRERLRATFDTVAERYDAARPRYPSPMIDDLVAGLGPGARVLEIGCGTGQLTVPLAERGLAVLAVELGADMAAVARRNLAGHPDAEVVVGAFEDIELPAASFDLVVAATAFHWLDPATRVARATAALRPGGSLAVVDTVHIAGGTAAFFVEVQDCYLRWDPDTPPDLRLPEIEEVPTARPELDESPLLGPVRLSRHEWDADYTSTQFRELLNTYSNHLALPPADLTALLDCIGTLIDTGYGGRITKRYLFELRLARRT